MSGYWSGTIICHRRGFCHVTHAQCLETHELRTCGECPHFLTILEHEQRGQWNALWADVERQSFLSQRRKGKHSQ